MSTKEQRERLRQLANAIREVELMRGTDVADSIRRTLRLLEMCPWLSDDVTALQPEKKPSRNGATKKRKATEPTK